MPKLFMMAVVIVAALGFVSTASAIPWAEVGDAGALPDTAQVPVGVGSLTSISGVIGPLSFTDADMYRFHIPVPGAFSATTVGTGGTLIDTQLFLFDLAGRGVYGRDDNPGTPRTTLPSGSPLGPQAAGDYFLAITGFNLDPVSAGGLIFPNSPKTMLFGPTGPGGGSPISGYTGFGSRGTYTINLTGAQFSSAAVPVPAPATFFLLATGLVGLIAVRGRRKTRNTQ